MFQYIKDTESESCSVMTDSLWPHGPYSLWNSPGQNTGVGSLSLLQGIFPTQGLNSGLLHCRWILYQLSHQGSPRIMEWVAYPFFSRSSPPRNRTRVSCIAGRFFTRWATRELKVLLHWVLASLVAVEKSAVKLSLTWRLSVLSYFSGCFLDLLFSLVFCSFFITCLGVRVAKKKKKNQTGCPVK